MARLLTLSRAARLVGISRGALQGNIKRGELTTFEGMVSADELVRLYPHTRLQDDSAVERTREIRDSAYAKRLRERIMPDPETLVARLTTLSRELAAARDAFDRQRDLLGELTGRLAGLERAGSPGAAALAAWLARELAAPAPQAGPSQALIARDNYLRVMTAQVHLLPSEHEFFVEGNDTILEAALRAGLNLNYGCSSGNCGLCRARVVRGETRRLRPHDYVLSEAEKSQGYVLLCSHTAVSDCVIEAGEAHAATDIPAQKIATRVHHVEPLSEDILLLHVQTPRSNRLRFLAGQSVTLALDGERPREHPIASCPCDDRNLQFHIRGTPADAFYRHVAERLRPSDVVAIEGPRGDFVLNDTSPRSLVFIAYDTGFAPIKSLVEHALALDIAATLHLYWVTATAAGQYLQNQCRAWTDALDNFYYFPIVAGPERAGAALGERLAAHHPRLADYDVYLAGNAAQVAAARALLGARGLPDAQLRCGRVA